RDVCGARHAEERGGGRPGDLDGGGDDAEALHAYAGHGLEPVPVEEHDLLVFGRDLGEAGVPDVLVDERVAHGEGVPELEGWCWRGGLAGAVPDGSREWFGGRRLRVEGGGEAGDALVEGAGDADGEVFAVGGVVDGGLDPLGEAFDDVGWREAA